MDCAGWGSIPSGASKSSDDQDIASLPFVQARSTKSCVIAWVSLFTS